MNKFLFIILFGCIYSITVNGQSFQEASHNSSIYLFKSTTPLAELEEIIRNKYNVSPTVLIPNKQLYSLALPNGLAYRNDLSPHIEYIRKAIPAELRITPNDTYYSEQSYHRIIQSEIIWELTTGGAAKKGYIPVITVLDRGVDIAHEDLTENIWINQNETPNNNKDDDENGFIDDVSGYDFSKNSPTLIPHNHGTGVAGIIGAVGNNNIGVTGVMWDAKILPLAPAAYETDIIAALQYAIEMRKLFNETNGQKGAYIVAINNSFGFSNQFPEDMPELCNLYKEMLEVGILSIVATPNGFVDIDKYGDIPSSCPYKSIISVMSLDHDLTWGKNSGFGVKNVDIAAPYYLIFSTALNNKYSSSSGTSNATPQISGGIGLLYTLLCEELIEKSLSSPKEIALLVRDAILSSAKKDQSYVGRSTSEGYLQLHAAATKILSSCEINEKKELEIIDIIPNPGHQITMKAHITLPDLEEYTLEIYNVEGKRVYQESIIPNSNLIEISLPTTHFSAGGYILKIGKGDKFVSAKFFVT